jgi:hypothetical protein
LILHHRLAEDSLCQCHGSRVTGTRRFIISLLKVWVLLTRHRASKGTCSEVTVRIEPSKFKRQCNHRPAIAHPIEGPLGLNIGE